ncbi:MAG: threonine/serine exporter family protein, partial [Clostridia bacterium]|nr:threonine/serine exporter family protein [Clostridia bacterium]
MEELITISENSNNTAKVDYERVLELALEIGVGILSCGGSVSRVETAVDRICRAYGAEEVNVAAFPSMIIAGARTADGHEHSYMKRVYSTSNNLALLEKYNQLSRNICVHKYPVDDALKMCFDLAHSKTRNKWITIAGASLVSGIYSIFFGGTVADVLPALLVAFVMSLLNEVLSKRSLNAYATTFLLSLVGGVLSVSLCKLLNIIGLPCQCSYVMIGTIMILIPGLLTTNAVRDMFTGDLMSGTFQLLNGILLAVVIAAGYGVSILALRPIADFTKGTFTGWYYLIENTT